MNFREIVLFFWACSIDFFPQPQGDIMVEIDGTQSKHIKVTVPKSVCVFLNS